MSENEFILTQLVDAFTKCFRRRKAAGKKELPPYSEKTPRHDLSRRRDERLSRRASP